MLTHHEPITEIDFTSLSPNERAAVVQDAIRRAHAERARAIGDMAKGFFRLVTFRRGARGHDASAHGSPPKYARHA